MKYLLDTCFISELARPQPNPNVLQWFASSNRELEYLSVITIGEIHKGIEKLPTSKRKSDLQQAVNTLLIDYADRILPININVMIQWGKLIGKLEQQGRPMELMDSLIAATALTENCTLITRNEKHFQHTDVHIINPWKP
jgi:toxin FitB